MIRRHLYGVLGHYRSQKEVSHLRASIGEIKGVLTARKTGQTDLRKLWLTKTELSESLRILNAIERLKVAGGGKGGRRGRLCGVVWFGVVWFG